MFDGWGKRSEGAGGDKIGGAVLEADARYAGAGATSGAPGKRTLTQQLAESMPLATPGSSRGAATPRPAPARVADAKQDAPALNAVMKVVVIDDGKAIQQWQSKARWEGPLPVRWTATRGGGRWQWDNANATSLRVQTNARGGGGQSIEAWAQSSADRIVVHVQASDDVTIDADAEADAEAPGHARDARDAGNGSMPRLELGRERPPQGERRGEGAAPDPEGGGEGATGTEAQREQAEALEPSAADEQLADGFERELGLELGDDGEDAADRAAGEPHAGKGEAGGDRGGRTGDDTRKGGTGPGGAAAKADGKGSEDGRGAGGSEGGSRDGAKGGDEEGMYGGKGEHGDRGVPSAIALFGGLVSVPAALRGFVELGLIVSSADVTGAGAQLFKKGLGKLASAAAARKMIAHEARMVAVQETKAAIKRIATDKQTAKMWARATAEERKQTMRIIYWELQRKHFKGYLDAAKRAQAEARAVLRKTPRSADAQRRLATAEMAEEAATAAPVAGRLPRNHEFAGKQFPRDRLPPAYRAKGVKFTDTGFPDFEPFAKTLPNGKKYVEIRYTGSREADFVAANAKAGFKDIPIRHT